ncbi:MAG: hypothetical protein LBD87_06250 [Prevotellaceae bacterium]|jgi:hypothetical protein|nr:hypothetical protein [Prevotellaceae bacterium]
MTGKMTNSTAGVPANEKPYRLLIEKTGKDFLRISLQRWAAYRWKTQEREYCHAGNKNKWERILHGYVAAYRIAPQYIIDTCRNYRDVSWTTAILRELKLNIEFYIWKKRFERLKKQLTYLHEQSGKGKHTRRKYWIVTDDRGDPMEMNPQLKDFFKRKGWYGKQVDAIALDNECLWCTNFLYR